MVQTQMPPAITKLDNVPGPEDNFSVLCTHYSRVQVVVACHNYDDVILTCRWCCDMESPLVYSKPEQARGNKMFCSGRCASAYGAFRAEQLRKPKDAKDLETANARPTSVKDATPTSKARRRTVEAGAAGAEIIKPVEDKPDAEPDKDETAAPSESPSTWKPKGQREKKPRQSRSTKPERTDGKCSKGLHEMTDANRYEYKNTVWCRACRADSRKRSAAKKNGV